ncbi:F0F1 ATP synthase subunit A [Dermatophilus congolensis]|uniref:ATP synthase subunit a n=1 Tax=Dermatophilus congolensis TaxID=1863 RepID=A0A239VDJ9_9MICO|nr:F0F1 ATP synthase subunit A [Dermatophilus congolensis]MBO3128713.1 F0F1 ATP synthase subunit A [Dermatophilus congolensis]MBO3132650.1 F0F1 ATP synthase subunit A [Dermatophilus congolensis]MBO3133189.1 F0F1 ATP synthase subunit A [Dermatophilus congolensis]MBO3135424.1 F0F1 ATP synthase subunit A [Dermatophilus congolensis]MBO3137664.1 F0F1 ATP synthase subunit A [Dermatophilus congolensis]
MSFTSAAFAGALTASGSEFVAPSTGDFWTPLIGDGAFAFTRPMLVSLVAVAIIATFLFLGARRAAVVPTKSQFLVEFIYDFVRNGIARDMIGSKHFLRFLPLLLALFTFILANNLAGVIPFLQNPPTGRIAFPLALVLVVYLAYHYVGLKQHGVGGYLKTMVPGGLPAWIVPFIFLIEFVTKFLIQPMTLTLRLFGNMLAGHMTLVLFILGGEFLLFSAPGALKAAGIAAYGGAFLMTCFEMLIQFLQAYVFTLLTASYISSSLEEAH